MSREVEVFVGETSLKLSVESVAACIRCLDEDGTYNVPFGTIEVAFVDVPSCCRLHEDFFGDPDPTDVMTFPAEPGDGHAGDIAICPQVATEACTEHGLPFEEELTLYLVHAWLHLAGLRDDSPQACQQMRQGEALMMERLRDQQRLLECLWQS
ncbi:MAG: rRNA maturation RNase YbeY [Opitutales bacterium]|jgi:probable rRNA maturation factor